LSQVRLDIILPCYNPPIGWAENVVQSAHTVQAQLGQGVSLTVILVNDGSQKGITEQDIQVLKEGLAAFEYVTYTQNRGKGFALRKGVAAARGDLHIYTDIDFPYTTQSLQNVFALLQNGEAEVVAGVRDEKYYDHVPGPRRRISKILRWMLRTFLRLKVTDTQCGLKGFNPKGREIFLQTRIDRFLFDLEFVFLASNEKKTRLLPAQVELRPGIEFSKARMGILARESVNFLWIFLRGIKRRIFG
jgi:glycosyltransferase involved in cell wall biosynthesis